MNTKLILTSIVIFFTSMLFAQAPAIQWQKTFGGSNGDIATSIQQTTDGGYILAGFTSSTNGDVTGTGTGDALVVKFDIGGTIQWQKTLGGSMYDSASSIQQTTDGGYILAGYSNSNDGDVSGNHGSYDFWVVKLDNSGSVQWQKSLGGNDSDLATSIKQTTDGGYVVCGRTVSGWILGNGDVSGNHGSYDFWVVKLNNNGAIQWQKCLGGSGIDEASSIQQTTDGGYIVGGYSNSINGDVTGNKGSADYWIVKLDNNGAIQWQKSFGSTYNDSAKSIQQTLDGGYIMAGTIAQGNGNVNLFYGNNDYWVVKLTSNGEIQWQKTLGGSNFDDVSSIQQTSDGGYIVGGSSSSNNYNVTGNHGSQDYWVVKLNTSGVVQWQKSMGGSDLDIATSLQQTSDGGYIVAGYSLSNNGDVSGAHGDNDIWVVKLYKDILSTNEVSIDNKILIENPVKGQLNIQTKETITSLQLYNVTGQLVKTATSQNISVKELAKGNYILKIQLENGKVISEKIVKE